MTYYNGTDLLTEPGFWAVHLIRTHHGEEAELAAAFGVTSREVDALDRRLADTERWPVFRIELPGRVIFRVIYRNSDPDFGTDFLLSHPAWQEDFTVTWLDGHPGWPGLSWQELCWLADHPPPGGRWISEWERRLLLFLPCMGDADMPATAADTVAEALERVGAAEPAGLAARLVDGIDGPSWYLDPNGALVCDSRWGPRSMTPSGRLTPTEARTIARAFTDMPLGTIPLGDGPLENEVREYVRGLDGPDIACRVIEEIQRLLAHPGVSDDELRAFLGTRRFIGGGERRTLQEIADHLEHAVRHPPRPHPFTRRAPNLSSLLREFTRGHGDLDELVYAGADWLGVLAVRTAVRETEALLDDPAVTGAQLSEFIRSQSLGLVDDPGPRTADRIVGALRRWALESPERNLRVDQARIVAEKVLDQTWRRKSADIVIDDNRIRERPDSWSFTYNTRAYLRTGNPLDMLKGTDPLIIDRVTGKPRFAPTRI